MEQKIQKILKISRHIYNSKNPYILILMVNIKEILQNYGLMDYQNQLDKTIQVFLFILMTILVWIADKFVLKLPLDKYIIKKS
jgi:hypothetical protein